jgi:ubiquinone/menaquinone biosynthesis C-methylase UbiE
MIKPEKPDRPDRPERPPQMLVGWMEALADRTRLRLLRILEEHELGVIELCEILQMPQSTVSRHLKILADQRWVHPRPQGTTRLHRMIMEELDPPARKLWLLAREQTDDWATVRQDELRLARRLQHREADSQAFFAGAAGKWDKLRRDLYGDSFTTAALLALLPSDFVVADLGCGTGQVAAMLAEHVHRVIGVDNSSAMLKAARKRLGDQKNVELLRAQLGAVPLEPASCHAAMLLLVLTYTPDPVLVLKEAVRILKPGGKLIVVDLLTHDREGFRRQMGQQHSGFDAAQFGKLMNDCGLTGVTVRLLPPEKAATGPALFLAVGVRPDG